LAVGLVFIDALALFKVTKGLKKVLE
jgi:hypothetical protein